MIYVLIKNETENLSPNIYFFFTTISTIWFCLPSYNGCHGYEAEFCLYNLMSSSPYVAAVNSGIIFSGAFTFDNDIQNILSPNGKLFSIDTPLFLKYCYILLLKKPKKWSSFTTS